MNEQELKDAYALSARPYLESQCAVDWHDYINLRSWRYVLEINSQCNLRCAFCHAGNRAGYQSTSGVMKDDLRERILDKIATENPKAIVCCYVNSDPFLHPKLAEVVRSIRGRGLSCEVATNGNLVRDIEGVLAAGPTLLTISMSGWTQAVYERAHRGGDVETVKKNIADIAHAKHAAESPVPVGISYHMYNDNQGEEMEQAKQYAQNLGLMFIPSWGRVISMENAVMALRRLDEKAGKPVEPFEIKGGTDLNRMLPAATDEYLLSLERLHYHPRDAVQWYGHFPVAPVCIIADVFTEIRHDGRVQLCAWTDDERLTIGNYLEMTQEQISAARRFHPLCRDCLKYRMNLYFHIVAHV